jgi:catechol 2,3-dioxygenase-like lactoylglutathione lyase family enzyme
MTTIKRISPMLAVAYMDETLAFYRDVLGFEIGMQSSEYSIVSRDGATIHLMKAADDTVMTCVRGHTEIYIEVDDLSTLWSHVEPMKDRYKIRGLVDQSYGMTEFHINDPNDCLVFIGQTTKNG